MSTSSSNSSANYEMSRLIDVIRQLTQKNALLRRQNIALKRQLKGHMKTTASMTLNEAEYIVEHNTVKVLSPPKATSARVILFANTTPTRIRYALHMLGYSHDQKLGAWVLP